MVLLPQAFMFSYNPRNPNYPPFFSPWIRLCGYPTSFPKPSKQLWLHRWLKQYVALWLGFSFQHHSMNALVVQCKFTYSRSASHLLQMLYGRHVGLDNMSWTMQTHQKTLDLYCLCRSELNSAQYEYWGGGVIFWNSWHLRLLEDIPAQCHTLG